MRIVQGLFSTACKITSICWRTDSTPSALSSRVKCGQRWRVPQRQDLAGVVGAHRVRPAGQARRPLLGLARHEDEARGRKAFADPVAVFLAQERHRHGQPRVLAGKRRDAAEHLPVEVVAALVRNHQPRQHIPPIIMPGCLRPNS